MKGRTIADYPHRLDINWGVFSPDYLHCNGIDYNPETGHIAISSNRTHEIYIIDHDGTFVAGDPEESHRLAASEAGDFLYRFGNPATYGQGEYPHWGKKNCPLQEVFRSQQMAETTTSNGSRTGARRRNCCAFNNGLNVRAVRATSDPAIESVELNPYWMPTGGHRTLRNPPQPGYTDAHAGHEGVPGTRRARCCSQRDRVRCSHDGRL